ncbi:helix-turn-helix domain-containing protein [Enterococcus casseliflavus]|uniref:helix-turn-helix domain-containing protein n=1 Tax=Enterococcus casseliflavus TaxID=37734 RepID=UPI00041119C4|nr:helix-turn-helix domain-containing protein [Enterococcus casseliflavus]
MTSHRGYFAIIPANVRYDQRLKANTKLLYGEITALCNERGFCWATNDYFADLYGVSKETISRWISQLIKFGYLNREIVFKDGTREISHRYLRINHPPIDVNVNRYPQKDQDPIDQNVNTPIDQKVKDNSTSINNTINNTNEYIRELPTSKKSKSQPDRHKYGEYKNVLLSDDQMEKLKSEFPNDWEERIDRVSEYCEVTGKTYKNYLATIRAWAKKDKHPNNKAVRKPQTFTRQENLPEWATEPINYSTNKPKVTEEDRRRFLNVSDREEGF